MSLQSDRIILCLLSCCLTNRLYLFFLTTKMVAITFFLLSSFQTRIGICRKKLKNNRNTFYTANKNVFFI